jgi:hypothetical protein
MKNLQKKRSDIPIIAHCVVQKQYTQIEGLSASQNGQQRSPQPQINLLHPQKGDRYNPRYEGTFLLQLQANDFPCITNRRSPEKRINLLQPDKSHTPIVGDMGVNYA